MGPWSDKRQHERADAIVRLLAQNDLDDWSRNFWIKTLNSLAKDEDEYNARVKNTYQNMIKWRNPFDE